MAALGAFVGTIVLLAILLALAIPLLIIWFIAVVIRDVAGGGRRPRGPYQDPAVLALRARLARGEISQAQFEQGMYDLGYEKAP